MIDEELDERREFIAHEWKPDGTREVGGDRQRCSRCGTLSHWPGARVSCSMVLSQFAMQSSDAMPMHADQYSGPYVEGNAQCDICRRSYRKPARHQNGKTCSVMCSQNLTRQRQRANRALRAQRVAR